MKTKYLYENYKRTIITIAFILLVLLFIFMSDSIFRKRKITMEEFKNINNVYGTWKVVDCKIIKFDIDKAKNSDGIVNFYNFFPKNKKKSNDKELYKQVKISKKEEKEKCKSYLGKEIIISKALAQANFNKYYYENINVKNPEISFEISKPYEEVFNESLNQTIPKINKYMMEKRQKLKLSWFVKLVLDPNSEDFDEDFYSILGNDLTYYNSIINDTIFENDIEIINYPICCDDLYLILEKIK